MTISNNQQQSATISNNQQQSATISNNQQQSATDLNTAHNADYTTNKLAQLRQILPEIFCEQQIDFEKLKLIIGKDNIADQNERYHLNWAGKSQAYQTLQSPSYNTLTPCKDDSVDFDTTKNLFIESDNLEALKILQKSYHRRVKMIYIDPPYNTGSDSFIYPDKFGESRDEYAHRVGDKDQNGYLLRDGVFVGAMRKNSKDNGHYHSNWLNMMLPRLHLAKNLLTDDGVIFISIDDNEQAQLKLLCDEIFGAENVELMIWRKSGIGRDGKMKNTTTFRNDHEYIIVAFKNAKKLNKSFEKPNWANSYDNPDNDPRGNYKAGSISNKEDASNPNHQFYYTVTSPSGKKFTRQFNFSFEDFDKLDRDNRIYWGKNLDAVPSQKIFENEEKSVTTSSLIDNIQTTTTQGSKELENILGIDGLGKIMRPKPILLIKKLLQIGSNENDIVLDFFSGTSTTAHSIFEFMSEKNENKRQFIMVQLPEFFDLNSATNSDTKKIIQNTIDFCKSNNLSPTIADIAKERILRAGEKIKQQNPNKPIDTGFKVFKLSQSNFKSWQQQNNLALEKQFEMFVDNLHANATDEGIVYELLLRLGLKLTIEITADNGIYWLDDGEKQKRYAIILHPITKEHFFAIIDKKVNKVIALDKVFDGQESLKANIALQFKDAGIAFETV